MRNILGIAGGAGLVLLVAVTQIHTAQPTPGGFISGNAFAQEPRRSASDEQQETRNVDVLQLLHDSAFATAPVPSAPADAAPRPEPRGERRFSQTPDRWALTPTPTM
jgi:hypothetical protein